MVATMTSDTKLQELVKISQVKDTLFNKTALPSETSC